jgi:hypothetical protein
MTALLRNVAVGLAAALVVVLFANTASASFAHARPVTDPVRDLGCRADASILPGTLPSLLCTQPIGRNGLFTIDGQYVGHDEPNMRFISSAPGSGNSVSWQTVLPIDNTSAGGIPSWQDFPTFWFGMALCDNNSYPQHVCINNSDLNTGLGKNSTDAGAAVMELQFYPPDFDGVIGCDDGPHTTASTHWCAALTIDSLECTFGFVFCNQRCTEPVNFAFLTFNGVPVAPPSPQLQNINTFIGNQTNILRMNPGDKLAVTIHDTSQGLFTGVQDLSQPGLSGFMEASASNGFMHTNLRTCAGTPYGFHSEYSSASLNNLVPWAALELGISLDVETGHFQVPDKTNDPRHGGDDNGCLTGPYGPTVCLGTDFDFDGVPYTPGDWPGSTAATAFNSMPVTVLPSAAGMLGPTSGGLGYPMFELQTDIGFTVHEVTSCNILVPNQCGLPNTTQIPTYAGFYPFYSNATCDAVFGDVTGTGVFNFGGDAGYGSSQPAFIGTTVVFGTNGAFYSNSC